MAAIRGTVIHVTVTSWENVIMEMPMTHTAETILDRMRNRLLAVFVSITMYVVSMTDNRDTAVLTSIRNDNGLILTNHSTTAMAAHTGRVSVLSLIWFCKRSFVTAYCLCLSAAYKSLPMSRRKYLPSNSILDAWSILLARASFISRP